MKPIKWKVVTTDTGKFGFGQVEHPPTDSLDDAVRQVRAALKDGMLAHVEAAR